MLKMTSTLRQFPSSIRSGIYKQFRRMIMGRSEDFASSPTSCNWTRLVLAVASMASVTNVFAALPAPTETITTNDLMRHIRFLADDKLEGRESGGAGNPEATEYVAKEFRKYGLKPIGKSLLQPFEIGLNAELDESCALMVRVRTDRQVLKIGKDYLPFDNIDKGSAFGPMVFAGYGITAPAQNYDDYAGINATNKIVLILRRTGCGSGQFAVQGGGWSAQCACAVHHQAGQRQAARRQGNPDRGCDSETADHRADV